MFFPKLQSAFLTSFIMGHYNCNLIQNHPIFLKRAKKWYILPTLFIRIKTYFFHISIN